MIEGISITNMNTELYTDKKLQPMFADGPTIRQT